VARSKQRLKSKSKSRKTRVATEDDMDMLLELAELYNTNYDFEATEWFWGEYNREVTSLKNSETNIHKEAKELNFLKDLHQNLNWQEY
jgi:hypothetical protein